MKPKKILVIRKMSALEYYYGGKHESAIINESDRCHNTSIQQIKNILEEAKVDFDIITRRELSETLMKKYDAVISAGGDGTVIAVAAYNVNTPQLNLKTDTRSVGAICQQDLTKSLKLFLEGKYKIEEWQRQDVFLNGDFMGTALNETCIGEGLKFNKLARYKIKFLDKQTGDYVEESQSGSGLIIVTGLGSGAWPSAFETYSSSATHFKFRNLLIHSGEIECGEAMELEIEYKAHEGKFAIDTKEFDFPRDSKLLIKLSRNPLRIVVPE